MNHYCILIISPPNYSHSHAFTEIALGLQGGFKELGMNVPIITNPANSKGTAIVLGANILSQWKNYPLPEKFILYNLEQIQIGSPWLTDEYLSILKKNSVWDYSQVNIDALSNLGIHDVKLCEIGFSQTLQRVPTADDDIDVLFYGSINQRRHDLLNQLHHAGVNIYTAFNAYGNKRDKLIARAKIILNIHFYEAKIFELVRVSYLLANKRFVISETGSDPSLEAPYNDGMVFCSTKDLVRKCTYYLEQPNLRNEIALRGQTIFEQKRQADYLRQLISTD